MQQGGRSEEAEAALLNCRKIQPGHKRACSELFDLYMERDDVLNAKKAIEEAAGKIQCTVSRRIVLQLKS